jgi:hypothetical protein
MMKIIARLFCGCNVVVVVVVVVVGDVAVHDMKAGQISIQTDYRVDFNRQDSRLKT